MPRTPTRPLALLALAGMAALAAAQPADRAPTSPPLRGPSVEDTSIPGTARAFATSADMAGPQTRMLNREVPMGDFLAAIRSLGAPETPEDLRLTPAQREQFQAVVRDFTQAQREHMQAHREELATLAPTLGFDPSEMGRAEQMFAQRLDQGQRRARRALDGQTDDTMTPNAAGAPRPARAPEQIIRERIGQNPTPEQRAALDRLRQIRDSGPSMLEAQTLAWNILTQPQQQHAQTHLDQARQRVEAQRGEMYVQEMSRQIEGEMDRRTDAAPGSAAQRLHRLIDTLNPQEQEALLRLLETRLQGRLQELGGAARTRPGAVRQPPPPSMDQVNVPAPSNPV